MKKDYKDVINGVNFNLLVEYLYEYFSFHNELENYLICANIMKLINHDSIFNNKR